MVIKTRSKVGNQNTAKSKSVKKSSTKIKGTKAKSKAKKKVEEAQVTNVIESTKETVDQNPVTENPEVELTHPPKEIVSEHEDIPEVVEVSPKAESKEPTPIEDEKDEKPQIITEDEPEVTEVDRPEETTVEEPKVVEEIKLPESSGVQLEPNLEQKEKAEQMNNELNQHLTNLQKEQTAPSLQTTMQQPDFGAQKELQTQGYPQSNFQQSNFQQNAFQQNNFQQMNQSYDSFPQTDSEVKQTGPSEFQAEIVVPTELTNDPSLNFVGMMIGPGGYTQKQMEQSTGCSITVRGAGSSRNNNTLDPHRPMYVLVRSNTKAKAMNGQILIKELLTDKQKRDTLRQQQMAMRTSQINSAATTYSNPVLYMQQAGGKPTSYNPLASRATSSIRTPFQNAFRQSKIGEDMYRESIIVPSIKGNALRMDPNVVEGICYYSGAKIEVSDIAGNYTLSEIFIRGTIEQIKLARQKVQEFFLKDPNEDVSKATDYISVPNAVIGLVIGKNGETIKKFMSESNCRMKVVPEYLTNPDETTRKIVLFGNPTQCDNAKNTIRQLTDKHKSAVISNANAFQQRVEILSIPCGCIGILIGRGGETIRALGQRANCRVQVVQYDENQLFPGGVIKNQDMRHVSVKGDESSINKAKIEIQAIVDEHAHRHNYDPPQMHIENGDPYLGLQKEQYKQYLQQMKSYCGMSKEEVHGYYRSVMSEIAREPAEYSALVKQYLARAQAAHSQNIQMSQQQIGQPQMGQPQMGQPQMGQPQMGQPQMGQPQMGQPQMGQLGMNYSQQTQNGAMMQQQQGQVYQQQPGQMQMGQNQMDQSNQTSQNFGGVQGQQNYAQLSSGNPSGYGQ